MKRPAGFRLEEGIFPACPPTDFQVHLTDACNLKCLHCYNTDRGVFLNSKQFDYILDEVAKYIQAHRGTPQEAVFCGGEPTLSPILLESLRKCAAAGFKHILLLTNGLLITDQFARRLVRAGCTHVQICIEGDRKTHNLIRDGSWDQVLKAWEVCRRNGLSVSNQTTLHPLNYTQVDAVIDLCRGRVGRTAFLKHIPHLSRMGVLTPGQWLEVLERIFHRYRTEGSDFRHFVAVRDIQWSRVFYDTGYRGCVYLRDGPCIPIIEASGDVYLCRRGGIAVGNIFEKGLERVYAESEILRRCRQKKKLNQKCRNCEWLDDCGGCRALAKNIHGDIMAEDPVCVRDELDGKRMAEIEAQQRNMRIPRIDGREMTPTMTEISDYMRITGAYGLIVEEIAKGKTAVLEAKKRGIKVGRRELRQAVDAFRSRHGLTKARAFKKRLGRAGVTLDDLERHIETNILIEKLGDGLLKKGSGSRRPARMEAEDLHQNEFL